MDIVSRSAVAADSLNDDEITGAEAIVPDGDELLEGVGVGEGEGINELELDGEAG